MSTGETVAALIGGLGLLGAFLVWLQSQITSVRKEMSDRTHRINQALHLLEERCTRLEERANMPFPYGSKRKGLRDED